ncbi:hypothetical protein M3Y96_00962300 [Aphelenchoides besseyi]|nr:hypothetical protein M3Y96_00962300 [Aphelenchoides besseyi]
MQKINECNFLFSVLNRFVGMSIKFYVLCTTFVLLSFLASKSDASCCCCGGCGCCGCCRVCQYCCPQPPIIIQPPPALHNVCHVPCCCKPCCCCGCNCCGCCGGRRKRSLSDPLERRRIMKFNRLCKPTDAKNVPLIENEVPSTVDGTKKLLRATRSVKSVKPKKLLGSKMCTC